MFRSLGIASGAAKVAVILGAILFMRKRHEEAHAVYLDALPTLQAAGLLEEAYLCLYNLAEVSLELGRPAEAAAWHGKGVALLGEKGNPRFEAAYLELGALIAAAGGDAGSVPPPAPDHGT